MASARWARRAISPKMSRCTTAAPRAISPSQKMRHHSGQFTHEASAEAICELAHCVAASRLSAGCKSASAEYRTEMATETRGTHHGECATFAVFVQKGQTRPDNDPATNIYIYPAQGRNRPRAIDPQRNLEARALPRTPPGEEGSNEIIKNNSTYGMENTLNDNSYKISCPTILRAERPSGFRKDCPRLHSECPMIPPSELS